jgi:imidazolonepropionase-like amidohydrolase
MRLLILILCAKASFAQVAYDLLLKGGHVIDPKNKISAVRDVAIRDGLIAAVAADIPAAQARKLVDVNGLYVTPGLIDLHAHVFAGSEGAGLAGGRAVTPAFFPMISPSGPESRRWWMPALRAAITLRVSKRLSSTAPAPGCWCFSTSAARACPATPTNRM